MTLNPIPRTQQKPHHNWNPTILSILAVAATLTGCAYDPCYVRPRCAYLSPQCVDETIAVTPMVVVPVAPAPSQF
jgi:hypothetical protein